MGSPMEYRATLSDGTVMGFDQAKADALCCEHSIVPEAGEPEYAYRLRALRHLTAKDIRSWELSSYAAPIIAQPSMSAFKVGILLLMTAGAILLLLSTLSV